jgi:ABC-type transporter Mla subunit MlaD
MPNYNYDEIIKQSQANVKSLSEKLKDLDKLYQDIISLKTKSEGIPLAFEQNFQKISELSKQYTETLGVASKTYLDGNNTLFTTKLKNLADTNTKLEKEISRLVNTDLTKLFNDLQKVFIDQTKKDIGSELKKIEEKTTDFQTKINSFGVEISRLEKVNLEKHFDKLQKTLSDIFGAINAINLTLIGLTNSLNSVIQTLGQIQKVIEDNFKETNKLITTFSQETNNHLNQQDKKNDTEFEILKKEVANLSEQNIDLKKDLASISEQNIDLKKGIKTNKKIQIVGLVMILIILVYVVITKH